MAKSFESSMDDDRVLLKQVLVDLHRLKFKEIKTIKINDPISKLGVGDDAQYMQERTEVGEQAETMEGAYSNMLKLLDTFISNRTNFYIRGTVLISPCGIRPTMYEAWLRIGRYADNSRSIRRDVW